MPHTDGHGSTAMSFMDCKPRRDHPEPLVHPLDREPRAVNLSLTVPAASSTARDGQPGGEERAQQHRVALLWDTLPCSDASSITGQTSAGRSGKTQIGDQPLREQHLLLSSSCPSLGVGTQP